MNTLCGGCLFVSETAHSSNVFYISWSVWSNVHSQEQWKSTNQRFVISLHKFTNNLFHKLGELILDGFYDKQTAAA